MFIGKMPETGGDVMMRGCKGLWLILVRGTKLGWNCGGGMIGRCGTILVIVGI